MIRPSRVRTVGSNGILAFGTNNNAFAGSCLPVPTATYETMPFYRDQRTDAVGGCTGCGIFTTTTGTAPNRVFRVEYRTTYFGETSATPTLNYEVNLYESGSPAFDYTYGLVDSPTTRGRITSIGVQQNTTLIHPVRVRHHWTEPAGRHRSEVDRYTPSRADRLHRQLHRPRRLHPVVRLAGLRVPTSRVSGSARLASISRPMGSFMPWAGGAPTWPAAISCTHLNMIRG